MKNTGTVRQVVVRGVCTGCGTCAGMCPRDAVRMVIDGRMGLYVPDIDLHRCNECGLCLDVCPGHAVDSCGLNEDIFGKNPEDTMLGNYIGCYIGHAADCAVRFNSASGGLVTALLTFALEEGIIDGALVTRMKEDHPLEPQPFIARTKDEIVSAATSKYCPVPANAALREIINSKGEQRFAVVGLPCHIQGVRRAEKISGRLRSKVALHLGIFCWHTDTFLHTDFLLRRYGIRKADVSQLHYRGRGWPGAMTIEFKNGTKKEIPLDEYMVWHMLSYRAPRRCRFCSDALAELADISFGDAWLPEFRGDRLGRSIAISRNLVAEDLLRKARDCGTIAATPSAADKAVLSQKLGLYSKKKVLWARMNLIDTHLAKPSNTMRSDVVDYGFAIYEHFSISGLTLLPLSERVLRHVPLRVMRLLSLPLQALPWIRVTRLVRRRRAMMAGRKQA